MNAIAIIPARYASTRFPGKALALLQGKPIIQHVYERVLESGLFQRVIIATDSLRISDAVQSFGGVSQMTDSRLASGTDRIADIVSSIEIPEHTIIVNVQGDEPLISRDPLLCLLNAFNDSGVRMASLMTHIGDPSDIQNPNCVKVVVDRFYDALYFSRSKIPFDRDGSAEYPYMRHIGVYAYQKATLLQFVTLPESLLEQAEKLEQLRALENGIKIRMVNSNYQGIGIDTPDDLVRVEAMLSSQGGIR